MRLADTAIWFVCGVVLILEPGTGFAVDNTSRIGSAGQSQASVRILAQNKQAAFTVGGKQVSKAEYEAAKLLDDGLLLLRANSNAEALEKFKESIAHWGRYAEAHHALALAYAKLGKLDDACAELRRAVELNPASSDSWLLLAGLLQSSGKLQDSMTTYNEFLNRFPGHSMCSKVNVSLGLLYAKLGNSEEAVNELKRSIESNPELAASWISLAGVYQAKGDLDRSIKTYEEFLHKFPDDPASDKIRGLRDLLAKERDRHEERRLTDRKIIDRSLVLKESIEKNPDNADNWIELAEAYELNGDYASALRTYDVFLSRFPAEARFEKARSRRQLIQEKSGQTQNSNNASLLPVSLPNKAPNDDYLGVIPWTRWPKSRIPVSVYLSDGSKMNGYRNSFRHILKRSFDDWSKASEGAVSFVFVDNPEQARLKVYWTDKVSDLNGTEAGEARLIEDQSYISQAEIWFLTRPLSKTLPLTDNFFRVVALHELGHALGLSGHTTNPEDIMFYSTTFKDAWRELSSRDVRTIRALYKSDI